MDTVAYHTLGFFLVAALSAVGRSASISGTEFIEDEPMNSASDLKSRREAETSFLHAVDAHEGIIRKIARTYSNSRPDEKDLYQEIIYQLWHAYPSFRRQSSISTWIYSVALRSALAPLRRAKVPLDYREDLPDHSAEEPGHEVDDRLFTFLRSLEKFDRAILILTVAEYSQVEIAAALLVDENFVAKRMQKLRKDAEKYKMKKL